jgi:hypothetical protein
MKLLILKRTLPYLPEILLFIAIGISFVGEIIETSRVNYFMIGCGLILSTLIIWKNKYFALSLSIILGLVSFYMLLAVFAEYNEFPSDDRNGWQLLFVGGLIFTSLLAVSIFLPRKYFNINNRI